jgi:hypothetical protein
MQELASGMQELANRRTCHGDVVDASLGRNVCDSRRHAYLIADKRPRFE